MNSSKVELSKQVYIPSIEACDIYSHMIRGDEIKFRYVGMIPTSLELNKLRTVGLIVNKSKTSDNLQSDDVINVKFQQKVKSGIDLININQRKQEKLQVKEKLKEKEIEYKNKLKNYNSLILQEKHLDKWKEVKTDSLRDYLYTNGFVLQHVDEKTGEVTKSKYVVYKRSSAKSRVGQCLFIKEHLYNEMISWSRMRLPFGNLEIDFASLLAYESLVGSSIEDVIEINPENILIVDDVESVFPQECNVIRTGHNGLLDSFKETIPIKNSLFDGQSLLDSRYFPEGKGMKLLRNHMFKSAAFNTNLQEYFRDSCPENIRYEEWHIPNMFNEPIPAKSIHMVITPSSLKALKFSNVIGTKQDMWAYWKKIVAEDGNLFGVCKTEKPSKQGEDTHGNVIQQTSYQMLNCLPITRDDIEDLVAFELDYIAKLKNDDDFFIKHISKFANEINSNEMFIDLYKRNKSIVSTQLFRDFRSEEISNHVKHIKKGKLRLNGDYCVMLGNPLEFLLHAIGKLDLKSTSLKRNQIYTTLFPFDKELVGFRNPNTSPSNVLIAENTYNKDIEKYFNLTPNIACVNAVDFPLQDILSGSDYDSDTLALFDHPKMLELAKSIHGKYLVCINKVKGRNRTYQISKENMAEIDKELAKSKDNIGTVVNLGQWCMSTYWDHLNKGKEEVRLSELLKKVDVMTVLSGICIDLAKKFYNIKIDEEIKNVESIEELGKEKPLLWNYISKNDNVKTTPYDCPMDYLIQRMTGLDYANHRKNVDLSELLIKRDIKKGHRDQEKKIVKYVDEMCTKIAMVKSNTTDKKKISKADKKEIKRTEENIIKYFKFYISKLTVKPDTMYAILVHISKNKYKNKRRIMNMLYKTQTETFLNAFKQ